MAQASHQTILKLHGDPHRLALTHPALAARKAVTVDLPEILKQRLGAGGVTVEVRRRFGEEGHLRLRLPRTTAPGRYQASLRSDEDVIPLEIEVAPYRRLKVAPASLTFAGAPGGDVSVSVTFMNAGNIKLEILKRSHLGIYDDFGVETAFASAYRGEVDDPMEMIRTFVSKLREGHGGLLKLRIEGAGTLEPGEQRTVNVTGHLPEKLKAGHAYHGIWTLEELNYAVFIKVSKREA